MYHICLELPGGPKFVFFGIDYEKHSEASRTANLYSIIYAAFGGQWTVQKKPVSVSIPDTKTA